MVNGPQALLYGVSGGGGVVNLTTKRARFAAPTTASFEFQVDNYGHKKGQLDYGMGTDRFGIRLVLLDQTIGGRRVFVGFAAAYISFYDAYTSVWCFFAAAASVLVYLFIRRTPQSDWQPRAL